jgi:hypothetical protein
MRKLSARRPSPALVISIVALFVAMGGTGYAALKLPKNSVGSKQIRTGAVGSSEVKNGSLTKKDFRAGQIPAGPRGLAGPAGTNGINGHDGGTGPRGPSDAWVSISGGPHDGRTARPSPFRPATTLPRRAARFCITRAGPTPLGRARRTAR